jgi:Cu-Zn family superoxide dismutase
MPDPPNRRTKIANSALAGSLHSTRPREASMSHRTFLLVSVLSLAACTRDDGADRDTTADTAAASADSAVTATLRDASGRDVGMLTISDGENVVTLSGRLTGLPQGEHAIHLHQVGRCEPPFESAGDHWNPTNRQHGRDNPQGPHLGDLPNLTIGADSSVSLVLRTPGGSLRGSQALLDGDGAAVVVHAQPDDHRTDPAGNAGDRIACGVVASAN